MNWLFPGFLAGAALIGLPILLHFLRAKPKTVVAFPSLRFLGQTAIRDTRRHRLRRWLTMLLRCLVIGAFAAAFARPFWINSKAIHRRATIVAIDNSMSMQMGYRWNQARNWACQQLDDLSEGDQAGLLLMQPSPTWLVPMTDDLSRVRSTLLGVEPGFEKTHYGPALRVAGESLARNPAGIKTLVWMADEQRMGWLGVDLQNALPPGVSLKLGKASPAPKQQAAIVALEKGAGSQEGVTATVRLFDSGEASRHITVRAGQRVLVEKTVSLHSGDNKISLPTNGLGEADGVRVGLDHDDLPADDTAWLALRKTDSGTVRLDSLAEADFLAHALLSTQKLNEGALKAESLAEGSWPTESVVIARNAATFKAPLVNRLDQFVDAGGPLWLFIDGSPEQTAWLKNRGIEVAERPESVEPSHLRDWDPEHPVLAAFQGQSLLPLLDVEFYRGFDLKGDSLVSLANWPDGKMAIAEWSGSGRRILIAGFPLEQSATDWPTRPSFVPFVHQGARWLGAFSDTRNDWRVGDSIPLPGEGTWRALDTAVPQPERQLHGGTIRPSAPGLYEFATGTNSRRVFAVNIQPEESDLTPWPDQQQLAAMEKPGTPASSDLQQSVLSASHEAAEDRQRLWWWLLAFCAVAMVAELALANRTSI
jgi:hypothetical protein